MIDREQKYNEYRDKFIRSRTQQEVWIEELRKNIEKAPEELRAKLPPIDHEISLKGFIPALYENGENVPRKDYAEQLYRCNKFIEAWNALVDENDAEADKLLAEFEKAGV